jgi:hypothetical protein
LSLEEIFLAFEYCECLQLHGIKKKAHLKITSQKEIEDKAKALLSENRSYNKSELQALLHWKLGDAYKNIKDKKVAKLEQLHWE